MVNDHILIITKTIQLPIQFLSHFLSCAVGVVLAKIAVSTMNITMQC